MKNLPKHLGGHAGITHLDEGVLSYFIGNFNIQSFLDVGCGPGGMVKLATSKGLESRGIDGDFKVKKVCENSQVLLHDFREGVAPHPRFDLGWSVEFLEHVDEEYMPFYMSSFQRCQYVFVTHAPPNKRGHHHVNCQTSDYWIDKFAKYGFNYLSDSTDVCRSLSTMKREFVRETGLVFEAQPFYRYQ